MTPLWIHGALNHSQTTPPVCGTSNGCTSNSLFLACSDVSDVITSIDFAGFGNVSQCPVPLAHACVASDSREVVERACLHKHNCTVDPGDFTHPACLAEVSNALVMATAVCARGPVRRANQLRFDFDLATPPVAATVAVASMGYNVLWCNGARLSPNELEPGRSNSVRSFYSTLDLLPCLRTGRNVLAAALGNGWWSSDGAQPGAVQQPPLLWLNGTIRLRDGGEVRVVTNQHWRSWAGPILYDSVYLGERRDLRLATPGWTSPGFDDTGWAPCGVGDAARGRRRLTEQVEVLLTASC